MTNFEDTDNSFQDYVVYAAGIVELANEEQYSANTVMNGLAIATAAMLIEFVADEDDFTDDTLLFNATEKYIKLLSDAVTFAKQQLALSV